MEMTVELIRNEFGGNVKRRRDFKWSSKLEFSFDGIMRKWVRKIRYSSF